MHYSCFSFCSGDLSVVPELKGAAEGSRSHIGNTLISKDRGGRL